MKTVIIQHEVQDFPKWKEIFDADEPNRAKAGVKQLGLYTSVKNPNDVTMIFEAPGTEVVEAYTSDPRVREQMEKAGVISQPSLTILNKV